jgi:hypothetical protein
MIAFMLIVREGKTDRINKTPDEGDPFISFPILSQLKFQVVGRIGKSGMEKGTLPGPWSWLRNEEIEGGDQR